MRSTHSPAKTVQSVPFLAGAPWVFLALWACYLETLNPSFLNDDSAETLAAGVSLGLAHPPGYPILCLLQRLFQAIPLGSPSWRGSLAAAALAALGATLLGWIVVELWRALRPRSPLGFFPGLALALGSAFLLGFSPTFWRNALTAKGSVYHLQLMILLGTLWTFGRLIGGARHRPKNLAAFWVLVGLGLAHHWPTQAVILTALGLGWLVARGSNPRVGTGAAAWVRAIALGFAAWTPLLLYAPLREALHPTLDFGAVTDWSRWKAYAGLSYYTWLPRAYSPDSWAQGWEAMRGRSGEVTAFLTQEPVWGWVFLFMAALVVWIRRFPVQALTGALGVLGLVASDLWVNRITGIDLWPLRNPLLGVLLIEIPVVAAAGALFAKPKGRKAFLYTLLALGLTVGAMNWKASDQSRETEAYRYGLDVFASCPARSLLLAEEDRDFFSATYLQDVRGMRKDLAFVPLFLWQEPWGIERWADRYPDWNLQPLEGVAPWDRIGDNLRRVTGAVKGRRPIRVTLARGFVWTHVLQEPTPWKVKPFGLTFNLIPKTQDAPRTPGVLMSRLKCGTQWDARGLVAPCQDQFTGLYDIGWNNARYANGKSKGIKP